MNFGTFSLATLDYIDTDESTPQVFPLIFIGRIPSRSNSIAVPEPDPLETPHTRLIHVVRQGHWVPDLLDASPDLSSMRLERELG
ncbi:hypothetical protein J6590_009993 [Homalodisca vitripennis]|nr:hypothetical protein J6590_009993 [Homalodisca vitripennis]